MEALAHYEFNLGTSNFSKVNKLVYLCFGHAATMEIGKINDCTRIHKDAKPRGNIIRYRAQEHQIIKGKQPLTYVKDK